MELQQLVDRAEIRDAITNYTFGIDLAEWDRLDSVFTPDAAIDYTESGGIQASYAEVKPWLVTMSRRCCDRAASACWPAFSHLGSVKWTWQFQRPAVATKPAASMTSSAGGC